MACAAGLHQALEVSWSTAGSRAATSRSFNGSAGGPPSSRIEKPNHPTTRRTRQEWKKLDPMKGISSRRSERREARATREHGNRLSGPRGDRQVGGHWAQIRGSGGPALSCPALPCLARVLFGISNKVESSPWLDSFSSPPPKVES